MSAKPTAYSVKIFRPTSSDPCVLPDRVFISMLCILVAMSITSPQCKCDITRSLPKRSSTRVSPSALCNVRIQTRLNSLMMVDTSIIVSSVLSRKILRHVRFWKQKCLSPPLKAGLVDGCFRVVSGKDRGFLSSGEAGRLLCCRGSGNGRSLSVHECASEHSTDARRDESESDFHFP